MRGIGGLAAFARYGAHRRRRIPLQHAGIFTPCTGTIRASREFVRAQALRAVERALKSPTRKNRRRVMIAIRKLDGPGGPSCVTVRELKEKMAHVAAGLLVAK